MRFLIERFLILEIIENSNFDWNFHFSLKSLPSSTFLLFSHFLITQLEQWRSSFLQNYTGKLSAAPNIANLTTIKIEISLDTQIKYPLPHTNIVHFTCMGVGTTTTITQHWLALTRNVFCHISHSISLRETSFFAVRYVILHAS